MCFYLLRNISTLDCSSRHFLFRQRNNPLRHPGRGLRWKWEAHLKLCRETKCLVTGNRCEQMRSLVWNVMNEKLRAGKGKQEWECWLQPQGETKKKKPLALSLRLVFDSVLSEEKVRGSPGQSRFYLPSCFVASSPLVTLTIANILSCPKHKSDLT